MAQKYIVVFKKGTTDEQVKEYVNNVNANGGQVSHVYDKVFPGFAAEIPDSFLQNLQLDSIIDYIEPDSVVTTQ